MEILGLGHLALDFVVYFYFFRVFLGVKEHWTIKWGPIQDSGLKWENLKYSDFQNLIEIKLVFSQTRKKKLTRELSSVFINRSRLRGRPIF